MKLFERGIKGVSMKDSILRKQCLKIGLTTPEADAIITAIIIEEDR